MTGTYSPPGRGWAFSTLGCSGMPVPDVVAMAEEFGCSGVELRSAADEPIRPDLPGELRGESARLVHAAGMTVLALNAYVSLCAARTGGSGDSDLGNDDDLMNDEQVRTLIEMVSLARDVGAHGVRVFMRDDESPAAGLTAGERRAIDRIEAVSAHCHAAGVRVLIETHDSHSRGERLSQLLTTLDREVPGHPCGVAWDAGHSWVHGEEPAHTLELLSPWLSYIQVKDIASAEDPRPVMLGEGRYPIEQLGAALSSAGWAGWASLEWERKWHPSLPALEVALERLPGWAAALPGL